MILPSGDLQSEARYSQGAPEDCDRLCRECWKTKSEKEQETLFQESQSMSGMHVSTDSTWGLQGLNPMRLVSPISFIKFDTLPWDWQHESHSHVLKHIREVVMGLTYLISRSQFEDNVKITSWDSKCKSHNQTLQANAFNDLQVQNCKEDITDTYRQHHFNSDLLLNTFFLSLLLEYNPTILEKSVNYGSRRIFRMKIMCRRLHSAMRQQRRVSRCTRENIYFDESFPQKNIYIFIYS